MTWWIVLLLVGAALSPLVWLRPSPQQRGQMVRLAARAWSLACSWGSSSGRTGWRNNRRNAVPIPPGSAARGAVTAGATGRSRRGSGATSGASPAPMRSCWNASVALPADVYKVEATPQMISLFWGERGGEGSFGRGGIAGATGLMAFCFRVIIQLLNAGARGLERPCVTRRQSHRVALHPFGASDGQLTIAGFSLNVRPPKSNGRMN